MTTIRTCVLPDCPGRAELPPDAHACPDCQARLTRKLNEIEAYLAIVSVMPVRGEPGRHAPGFASTPPLRLDVVAMFDPRTGINGDGPDDELDEVPNVWADLFGWATVLIDEKPEYLVMPQYVRNVPPLLRTRLGWIATRPWVDAFALDIARVHGALRRACKDAPPAAAGPCLRAGCGGKVYRRSDDPQDPRLRCASCQTTYDGLDLVRIKERA